VAETEATCHAADHMHTCVAINGYVWLLLNRIVWLLLTRIGIYCELCHQ